jgi:hypothetical protein
MSETLGIEGKCGAAFVTARAHDVDKTYTVDALAEDGTLPARS